MCVVLMNNKSRPPKYRAIMESGLSQVPHNLYAPGHRNKYFDQLENRGKQMREGAAWFRRQASRLSGHRKAYALANAQWSNKIARNIEKEKTLLRGIWTAQPLRVGPGNRLEWIPEIKAHINDSKKRYANQRSMKKQKKQVTWDPKLNQNQKWTTTNKFHQLNFK